MDKTLAGVIGAVTALTATAAVAAPITAENVMESHSYTDLLRPIPNATALLRAHDASLPPVYQGEANFQPIEYHDHHHHHRYVRRRYYHHHHHHHHHHHSASAVIVGPLAIRIPR